MNIVAIIVIVLVAVASVGAMALSIYPGQLNDLIFLAVLWSMFIAPVVCLSALVVLFVLARKDRLRDLRMPWNNVAVAIAMLFGTYVALKLYIPRRIAFAASRSSFERLVADAKPKEHLRTALHQRVGI